MTEKDQEIDIEKMENGLQKTQSRDYREGRWGEESEESSVNIERAEAEFQEIRRELSNAPSHPQQEPRLNLTLTRSKKRTPDEEQGGKELDSESSEGEQGIIDLEDYLRRTNRQREESGIIAKKVGVSFRDLAVTGTAGSKHYAKTFKDEVLELFGGAIYQTIKGLASSKKPEVKAIIQGFNGVVKPKEMLLVLGKPGSGSSTFLRAVTNQRRPFTSVEGTVHYSGVPFELAKGRYRGEILFNDEDDIHLPTLTVEQTLRFALKMKTPGAMIPGTSKASFVETMLNLYTSMFGMKHTLNTMVGNHMVRGVSGGERKRVSIMEAMASRATINAYDNSTRGLDSSTAIDYIRSLRILTTLTESTTIVTLYQAGESIYQEFDKVCLIDDGRQIYYGPANEARAYFEGLGYEPQPRSTTADFLTSITNENERIISKGHEGNVPLTPQELEAAFRKSKYFKILQDELDEYDAELKTAEEEPAKVFEKAVRDEKNKGSGKKSPYVVPFSTQVIHLTHRELMLKWQDFGTIRNYMINSVILALMLGALFYNIPQNSAGAFVTGGASFFSVVIVAWLQFPEGFRTLMMRSVAAKQVTFAFYRPAALMIAQMIADIPVMTLAVITYNIVAYFLVGFKLDAGAFFIHLLFSWITSFVITTFYRAVAAWSGDANIYVRLAMTGLNIFAFFGGYMQSRLKMRDWYRWISYLSPVAYAQEAVLTNQYSGRNLPCAPGQIIPQVPGASIENMVCNIPGSTPGDLTFDPSRYAELQFGFTSAHIWRNFGILIGFYFFFLAVAIAGVEFMHMSAGGGGLTKRFIRKTTISWPFGKKDSEESVLPVTKQRSNLHEEPLEKVTTKSKPSVFTFKNVNYTINGNQLLHNVEGIVKPGVLLALMGASGAGKTTLLDNLSQRKRDGIVEADLKVDGRELQSDFGRSTGYVEQADVHDETATVREAISFSAVLRQPKTVPKEEKLAFVDKVLNLLELEPLADALIGGLNIEEKKRVTIAVELAARPDTLLFLDEPTSGLDANGALSIVRFLRKLARESGLCIICTIHQPSSYLFQNFDEVLLLAAGGRTVYFGDIGHDGATVLDYYARNGAIPAAPHANPAEYILETVRPGGTINWSDVWNASPEHDALIDQIDKVNAELASIPIPPRTERPLTYAMPLGAQIVELTKRTWRNYWRDSSYQYSKVFSNLSMGLIAGVLFFQAGNSVIEMQARAFSTFIAIITGATFVTAVQPKFMELRAYYERRERSSKIYSGPAWLAAMAMCEIPYAFFSTLFFFFPYYYMVGFPTASSISAYQYLFLSFYVIFSTHMGIVIAAICPNFDTVLVANPLFFSITFSFTGILVPWAQLSAVFKEFVYYANPIAYAARGTIGNVVHGVDVICSKEELVTFLPPSGQSCAQYAGEWLNSTIGYFVDANALGECQYCQYKNGDEFLASVNINFEDRWKYFGYFTIFSFTTIALIFISYAAVWDIRWGKLLSRKKRE